MAAGLPTVRADTSERRALDAADRDPPTCRPDDRVADIAGLTEHSVVVVNEHGVSTLNIDPAPHQIGGALATLRSLRRRSAGGSSP